MVSALKRFSVESLIQTPITWYILEYTKRQNILTWFDKMHKMLPAVKTILCSITILLDVLILNIYSDEQER